MPELTERFFLHLGKRCAADRSAVPSLRRSLSFPPGEWPRVFRYVEGFVSHSSDAGRGMFYLAAGLWASARVRDGGLPFGRAARDFGRGARAGAVERRFVALLDADAGQLPHRLRQMCALLGDSPVGFAPLLDGLLSWDAPDRRTQWRWARDFYSLPEAAGTDGADGEGKEG